MSLSAQTEDYPQGNVIGQLAAYIVKARDKPAPAASRAFAVKCILDLVGCAAAGINDDGPAATRKAMEVTRPAGDIPVWFTGKSSSVIGAATANSAAAIAIDLDDVDPEAVAHWGAAVIATALAVGKEIGAPIEKVLNAIVIGFEVGHQVGKARARVLYGNAGIMVPYPVVATAAALYRTPHTQIEHALAIGGETAPSQRFMSRRANNPKPDLGLVKEGIPFGVEAGLTALELARNGFTGSRNILDDLQHYKFDKDLNLNSEGILTTCFKPYACCRHIHAPLIAMERLMADKEIGAEDIQEMVIKTNRYGFTLPNKSDPKHLSDLQYSIPYSCALVAIRGRQALVPLMRDALGDEEVIGLAERIKVVEDPAVPKADLDTGDTMADVTLVLHDGRQFSSGVTSPEGGGPRKLSAEQLEDKFLMATRLIATEAQQKRILAAIDKVDQGDQAALEECFREVVLTQKSAFEGRAVGVIGAGNAALAFAADVTSHEREQRVVLWAPETHRGQFSKLTGRLYLRSEGVIGSYFRVEKTTQLGDIVNATRFVICTTPTDGHHEIADLLSRKNLDKHALTLFPGNLGSIILDKAFSSASNGKPLAIFEVANSPYASRATKDGVLISGVKEGLPIAPLYPPLADLDPRIKAEMDRLFGERLHWEDHILGVGLSGENLPVHPATIVVHWDEFIALDKADPNTGKHFYKDFQDDDEVEELQNGIDTEIRAVLARYGYQLKPFGQRMMERYQMFCTTYREFAKKSPAHNKVPMRPAGLAKYNRMYDEDIPEGLVPVKVLAQKGGVATPSIDRVLAHFKEKRGVDPMVVGRNAEKLGWTNLTREQICEKYGIRVPA